MEIILIRQWVSTHSRPKAAGCRFHQVKLFAVVSTHSRPKAAGFFIQKRIWFVLFQHTAARRRLATATPCLYTDTTCFNTQPPEGGWVSEANRPRTSSAVSTHSRPKAAGVVRLLPLTSANAFQHTAARRRLVLPSFQAKRRKQFQHTAARRRLGPVCRQYRQLQRFQHTAARRRLACRLTDSISQGSFNTQPPEGGWRINSCTSAFGHKFQHTAARRRLDGVRFGLPTGLMFQHTAARRRLE